jgi:hypothetical protein
MRITNFLLQFVSLPNLKMLQTCGALLEYLCQRIGNMGKTNRKLFLSGKVWG